MNSKRIFFVFFLILSLTAATLSQSGTDKKKAAALSARGDEAYRVRNFEEAIRYYSEAAAILPANSYAHYWKAASHYELKQYGEAQSEYALALTKGFKPIDVFKARWYVFRNLGKHDSAIEDINKALQVEPRNLFLLYGLGENLRLRKSYPEAIAAFKRASALAPKDGDAHFYIARVHSDTGDFKSQVAEAKVSVKKGTRLTGEAYYLLGDGLERQKLIPEALAAYERAIAAQPLKYESYRNLSAIHQRQGKLADAIRVLERARLAIHAEGRIFTELAWLYSLADRHVDAVGSARGAVKFLPNEYLGYTNLCRALNDTKQYQSAVEACNQALRHNPNDGETYYYLGRASDFLKRNDDATRYYKQAVTGLTSYAASYPDYPKAHYLLANAYFSDGQRERALTSFQRSLEINPNFVRSRANVGLIYVAQGDKAAALEQHKILAAQDPKLAGQLKAAIDKMK